MFYTSTTALTRLTIIIMTIQDNLVQVRRRISIAAAEYDRDAKSIQLLAVSKTRTADDIRNLWLQGLRTFGENYLQEACQKIDQLADLASIEWHFIGPLQSNKTRLVAEKFSWCHTVDRVKVAQRLSDQRPSQQPPLNILLQVNISGEASKSGVPPDEVKPLAEAVAVLPNLCLRGIMAIPAASDDFQNQLAPYKNMQTLLQQLQSRWPSVDTLSIGMSNDLEAAICAGSTLLRIGTALFGNREA